MAAASMKPPTRKGARLLLMYVMDPKSEWIAFVREQADLLVQAIDSGIGDPSFFRTHAESIVAICNEQMLSFVDTRMSAPAVVESRRRRS